MRIRMGKGQVLVFDAFVDRCGDAREFADLGVKKERIAGRVRYIGISLKSDTGYEEAMKTPTYQADAA